MSQLIIAIGRESGSGGLEIARTLAERFGLPLYDKSILQSAAEDRGVDPKSLEQYDERPRSPLFYRSIKGFSSASEDGVAQMQFDLLRRHAAAGESFVVLGRCAEEVLADCEGLVSIFIEADLEFIRRQDRQRRVYHDQHCKNDWGDAQSYDLVINSARLGVPGTADVLEHYIRARQAHLDGQPAGMV